MENGEFAEGVSFYGYLAHAVSYHPEWFHRSTPRTVMTYKRALCGVGAGGMRIKTDKETGEILPWKGIDGCDRCHARVQKLKEGK